MIRNDGNDNTRLGDSLRQQWDRAVRQLDAAATVTNITVTTVRHSLAAAAHQLKIAEQMAEHSPAIAQWLNQTVQGFVAATQNYQTMGDDGLLVSWLLGQTGQLRLRLQGWQDAS